MQQVTFSKELRERIMKGIETVADPVLITMGPSGLAVMIKDEFGTRWTLDGVSVARSIKKLKDEREDAGATLVKTIAETVNTEVGDATSTACALTKSLANTGMTGVENKLNARMIKRGYEYGADIILEELKKLSRPVKTKKQMSDVATISSRDRVIGDVIAEIYSKVGPEGLINVEESNTIGTHYELVPGTEIDSGWVSPWFITNISKLQAEVLNPYIFLTTRTLSEGEDVINLLEKVNSTQSKALVIVAEDIKGEALVTLIRNKKEGSMKIIAVKCPGIGNDKPEFLEDLAILTGAKVLTDTDDVTPETVDFDYLGSCAKVVSGKMSTRFVDGKGNKRKLKPRLNIIKDLLQAEKVPYRKVMLQKRHARLLGGVAILYTGSVSSEESSEKADRIEDAINNTKSAIQEGIVPGGGFALIKASKELDKYISAASDFSYRFGLEALRDAVKLPAQQILKNAGYSSEVILSDPKILKGDTVWNSATGNFCSAFKEGVVDAFKAERVALEQVVSKVGLFLVTGAGVTDIKEDEGK